MHVPQCVRRLWAKHLDENKLHDIQDIEAIGPLLVLETWPHLLHECLWVHWIDNNGALACLVNGSSSVDSSGVVAGMTWLRIAQLKVWPFTHVLLEC